ncbi:MAG: ferritin family protein [bacterium]
MKNDQIILSEFSDLEAYEIALSLEKNGEEFYRRAAKLSKNKEIADMFNQLAKEEDKHYIHFEQQLESVSGDQDISESEEGLFDYINSGIFGSILDVEKSLKNIKTDLDAIELAEEAEGKGILFYKALLDNTQNEKGKGALSKLLDEEAKHLETLARYKKIITKCS